MAQGMAALRKSALGSVLLLLLLLSLAPEARAVGTNIHIAGTGGVGVNMRSGPGSGYTKVGWIPEGASPDYVCYSWGERIGSVPIWFNVNYGGATGFYASFYDDSSYSSDADLQNKYHVPMCGANPPTAPAPTPAPAPPAPTSGPLEFAVFQADGGVYFRSSPHWSDTPQIPGVGIYNGDRVRLICGMSGEAVGPYANTWWSYVTNLSRSVGNGWVNHHNINDGQPANQPPPGEPTCGPDVPGASSSTAPATTGPPPGQAAPLPSGGSLYFSPYESSANGAVIEGTDRQGKDKWTSAPSPASYTMHKDAWYKNRDKNGCPSPASVVPGIDGTAGGKRITTVASWSLARATPFLLLKQNPSWAASIDYILMFDPGTQEQMTGGCGSSHDLGGILRNWLIASSSHKLVVLSGVTTADAGHLSADGHGHAGLQDALFAKLKKPGDPSGRKLRSQVVVCNYDTMSHPRVWINFRDWMNKSPITLSTCPTDPRNNKRPGGWHP